MAQRKERDGELTFYLWIQTGDDERRKRNEGKLG